MLGIGHSTLLYFGHVHSTTWALHFGLNYFGTPLLGHSTTWALHCLGTQITLALHYLGTSLLGHSTDLGTPLFGHSTPWLGHSTTWGHSSKVWHSTAWALHYLGTPQTWTPPLLTDLDTSWTKSWTLRAQLGRSTTWVLHVLCFEYYHRPYSVVGFPCR